MSTDEKIERLRRLRAEALTPNQRAVDRQHDLGKLTARERVELLLDKDSFQELDMFVRHHAAGFGIEDHRPPGDAVITGYGTVETGIEALRAGAFDLLTKPLIDQDRHVVIESPHPSPFSADRGFFGSRPFSRVNQALEDGGREPVDWSLGPIEATVPL